MPSVDYQCNKCQARFKRMRFAHDPMQTPPCPLCKSRQVTPSPQAQRLFDEIASFSDLAKDRN